MPFDVDRFWSRFTPEPNTGCLIWTGALTRDGYGLVSRENRLVYTHRLAFELSHGRPPLPGLDVCHACDFRPCGNVAHLFEGTRLVNVQDAIRKGRAYPPPHSVGEAHPRAEVNDAVVRSVRRLRAKGLTYAAIAERLTLNPSTVAAIATGQNWSHVS